MTISRSEDWLVGIVALTLVLLIVRRIVGGLRDGRLPLYRSYVRREEGPGRFGALLALHGLSLLLVSAIAADLLLDLGLRSAL